MATGKTSSPFLYKVFTCGYSGVTNATTNVTQTNLNFSAPEGYTYVGIITYSVGWDNGGNNGTTVFPYTINLEDTNTLQLRSISGSGQSGTARVVAIFARTDMIREV